MNTNFTKRLVQGAIMLTSRTPQFTLGKSFSVNWSPIISTVNTQLW